MKWFYFALLQLVLIFLLVGLVAMHKDKAVIVKMPPPELAQWYKPQSKRHVWLHSMFKLRREMQAVSFYASSEQQEHLTKWADSLEKNYLSIAEMVPTWQKKLDKETLANLKRNVQLQKYEDIKSNVNKLQQSCDNCHVDYQAITALLYRTPNFSSINVEQGTSFKTQMQTLTSQVNQVKIATDDGLPKEALAYLAKLKVGLQQLGNACVACHKKEPIEFPNKSMLATINSLEQNLNQGTHKEQAMDLGILAVQACANCHAIHRVSFDVKSLLITEKSITDLFKH